MRTGASLSRTMDRSGSSGTKAVGSIALGRSITYLPVSDDAKRKTLLGYGVPKRIVDMIEEYAQAYASGWGDFVTDTVADLLGHPPRDIADFVRDHAAAFTSADDN